MNKSTINSENVLIIWLNQTDQSSSNTLNELERTVNAVITFDNKDKCVDYVTNVINRKIIMIISGDFTEEFISLIHNIEQLHSIYMFANNDRRSNLSTTTFRKFKGIFNSIEDICKSIRQEMKRYDHDSIPISIFSSDELSKRNLNELPSSFMYVQILKEILCNIGQHQVAKEDLINFWYQKYHEYECDIEKIGEFERTYFADNAVYWYTKNTFVYSILNEALRTLDVNIIIKMGFFLHDLCRGVKLRYDEQSMSSNALTVYRGQGMSKDEFEKMKNSPDGLISFNCFLSTSTDRDVAMIFCSPGRQDPNVIPVLFKIEILPNSTCVPFCSLENDSNHTDEQEILFSMQSIFRINQLEKKQADNEIYWEVTLKSTNDKDEELEQLTNYIRQETLDVTGWLRLGQLLIKMGKFDKAEEIYQLLREQAIQSNDSISFALVCCQIGLVKHYKEEFEEALNFYEQSMASSGFLQLNSSYLPAIYNNVASIYVSLGKYLEALSFYKKTLEIEEKIISSNHPDLALTHNNIGKMYKDIGNYEEALKSYEKSLNIYQSSELPRNHPAFINIYNNIAAIHYHLENSTEAKKFHEKAMKTEEKSLPSDHVYLAGTYSSIGLLHKQNGDYTQALQYYHKALESYRATGSPDGLLLAAIYNNIATLYLSQKQYPDALEYLNKTLKIERTCLHENHPTLATTYNNIATVYHTTKKYSTALEFYQKACSIYSCAQQHPDLANVYNNIGVVHYEMKDYSRALDFFQLALSIAQNSLPEYHPRIQEYQQNMESAQAHLTESSFSHIISNASSFLSNLFRH
jgi:tetratricopeptide (TPR) repeat protein